MKTLKEIREDLKEVRYYYANQKTFDTATEIAEIEAIKKIDLYNQIMGKAPLKLVELYIMLYVNNNSQSTLAYDKDCSPHYIQMQNNKLCYFLQKEINKAGNDDV